MNIISLFNRTIAYIEETLEGDIDENKIASISGYSLSMFSRLFSVLTEMTLCEYIRIRRLSRAAEEIRQSDEKIIDIALKYGYESPDSFGAAFKSFHGFTPSQVRKGSPFRLASPIQLALSVKGGRSMNITIQKKKAFTAAGIGRQNISSKLCPSIWNELYEKYSHDDLAELGEGQSIGICHDIKSPSAINYMAGYIISDADRAKSMGLDVIEIEEAEYAIVELNGSVPECIHKGWKYVMEVFFPEHGYIHSGKPDFEYYYEGDMKSPNYKMELWIPIVKAQQ